MSFRRRKTRTRRRKRRMKGRRERRKKDWDDYHAPFHPDLPFKKKWLRTDGGTDGRTDRPSYRDAWTHLKIYKIGQGKNI